MQTATALNKNPKKSLLRRSRRLRYIAPGGSIVEITTRTRHGRHLLKPGALANQLIVGCLARALSLYPEAKVFAYCFMSNHYHLLAWFPDVATMAAFMRLLNASLGRELGRLYNWPHGLWQRRYAGLAVTDERAQLLRLEYIFAQGTKEGLIARPADWPGANCIRAFLFGEKPTGIIIDRAAFNQARRRSSAVRWEQFATPCEISLSPLPAMADWSPEETRKYVEELLAHLEQQAKAENDRLRRIPMGAAKILLLNPHKRTDPPRNAPPICHASTAELRDGYRNLYRAFLLEYALASEAWRTGDLTALARFPAGCFRPPPPSTRAPMTRWALADQAA